MDLSQINWTHHLLYGLAWLSFGLGHSLLARDGGRAWLVQRFGAAHRLAYNGIALVHFLAVYLLGKWLFADGFLLYHPAWAEAPRWGIVILGAIILYVGSWNYDMDLLTGLKQWRQGKIDDDPSDQEPFKAKGLNAYVRHPLYSGAFLIVWGHIAGEGDFALAFWASLYLIIGSRYEERALYRHYGETYQAYKRKVPAFLPYKGKAWQVPNVPI